MKRIVICCFSVLVLCWAQTSVMAEEESDTNWKDILSEDKAALSEQWQLVHEQIKEAQAEERTLAQQIRNAYQNGDTDTANELRGQLKTMHTENVATLKDSRTTLQSLKQDFRSNFNAARQDGAVEGRFLQRNPQGGGQNRHHEQYNRRGAYYDRREDIRDRREDKWDRQHNGGRRDCIEDRWDRREDYYDRYDGYGNRFFNRGSIGYGGGGHYRKNYDGPRGSFGRQMMR